MSATPNVDNAAGPRTRDEEDQCRQVDKIMGERRDMVSHGERRVRAKVATPAAAATFAVATHGAPSLMRLEEDALKLVCAQVHKDHRLPMRLACRALRDACPEASPEDKRALCYRGLKKGFAPIHTITPQRALCTSVPLFKWAIDPQGGDMPLNRACCVGFAVAAAGNVDVMRFLADRCSPWFCIVADWTIHTCETAARYGHLEMLKYLRQPLDCWRITCCPWAAGTTHAAAETGNLDLLQWVCAEGLKPTPHTVGMACHSGHDRMLAWLLDHAGAPVDRYASFWAANMGHLRCLEALWLRKHPMDNRCCYAAAGKGHLECLKWLRNVAQAHWDYQTCNHAAGTNQVECLRWALEHGATCLHEASRSAVARGAVACAELLMEFGKFRPSDWECCTLAAEQGQLEMLKWLRFHGGRWNASLVYQMVCVAHPFGRTATRECVHWARANGYDATVPGVEVPYLVLLDEMYREDQDVRDAELCALRDRFRVIYFWSN